MQETRKTRKSMHKKTHQFVAWVFNFNDEFEGYTYTYMICFNSKIYYKIEKNQQKGKKQLYLELYS